MKTAEILLKYMDEVQRIVEIINGYIEKGIEIFQRAKEWVQRIIAYIEQAIDSVVESMGGRPSTISHMQEDYMFV